MKTLTISATLALLTTFVQSVPTNSVRQLQVVVEIHQGAPTTPAPQADFPIRFFASTPSEYFDQTFPNALDGYETGR